MNWTVSLPNDEDTPLLSNSYFFMTGFSSHSDNRDQPLFISQLFNITANSSSLAPYCPPSKSISRAGKLVAIVLPSVIVGILMLVCLGAFCAKLWKQESRKAAAAQKHISCEDPGSDEKSSLGFVAVINCGIVNQSRAKTLIQ
jgi:hypothetical protein